VSVLRDAEGRVRAPWVVLTFTAIAGVIAAICLTVVALTLPASPDVLSPKIVFFTLPSLIAGLIATFACARLFKESTALESRRWIDLGTGFGVGALVLTISVLGPVLAGQTTLAINREVSWPNLLGQFIGLAPAGFGEELLLRGLGLVALRRWIGDVPAVVGSSAIFGLLHLTNPHASVVAAAIITLVGLWFGATVVRTGGLYFAMGLHVGWNFFQGVVWGQPVSGMAPDGALFVSRWASERGFWSGGDFGPEAAGWTAVVLATALVVTLFWRRRQSAN